MSCQSFPNCIILKLRVASQLLIETDGEWAPAKAVEDPNALVAIVHRTHFTHVGSATSAMAKINMQKSFNALEQGLSRSISEFKKEFDTLVRCMRGAGILEMDGETSAIWFLEKQYQVWRGAMVLYGQVNSSPSAAREVPRAEFGCSASAQTKW